MFRRVLLSIASVAAVSVPAHAQNAPQGEGEIVVSGQPLPPPPGTPAYGSVVIERERLANAPSGRLENVLTDVAGFQQFRRSDSRSSNPTAQGVTLRALGGNATSRALVLLDGVPMADPFFGYIPFSALAPERLASARVTRGGGSGPFGSGAVAGTIELQSAGPDDLGDASASAVFGSRDATELAAALTPEIGPGFATVSGRWDKGDGFFTAPKDQRGPNDVRARYDAWSVAARGVVPLPGMLELQARGLVFRDDRTLRFIGADSATQGEDASLRLIGRGRWQIDALAYFQRRDFSSVTVSATSFRPVLDQRETPSTGLGGKVELRPPVGHDHVLRIGGDVRHAEGELFEDTLSAATGAVTASRNAGGRILVAGAFVEDDWTVGPVTLTGGARIDRWTIRDGFFRQVTPAGAVTSDLRFDHRGGWEPSVRAGALWRANDAVAIRAAGYTGFRLPTLNELYRPFTVFPVTTQANAALDLERLRGGEIGIDVTPLASTKFALTAFHNRLEGAVANVTIGTNLRQRRNLDAIVVRGIEATASARWRHLALSASYAFSDAEVDAPGTSLDGFAPAQSPRHAASATLGWSDRAANFSATLRHVGAQFEDDRETDRLPPATTLDTFAALKLGRGFSVIGRAENLFGETVVTRKAGTSIDLGTPRTIWIGLRFGG